METGALPVGHSGGLIDAGNDPVLLRERLSKYVKVAGQMKEKIVSLGEQLADKERQLAELAPFAAQFRASVLSSANGGAHPGFRLVARVSTDAPGHGGTKRTSSWVCIGIVDEASGTSLQEWHTETTLLGALPSVAPALAAIEPHVPPDAVAVLVARIESLQDELRRHRVRSETLLRQRDTELAAARDALLAEQSRRIQAGGNNDVAAFTSPEEVEADDDVESGENGADDGLLLMPALPPPRGAALFNSQRSQSSQDRPRDAVSQQLGAAATASAAAAATQIERLLRGRSAAAERETALREAASEMRRTIASQRAEIDSLRRRLTNGADNVSDSGGVKTSSAPLEQDEEGPAVQRTGAVGVIGEGTREHASTGGAASSVAGPGGTSISADLSALLLTHEKLVAEYGAYRKRAVGLLRERDDALRRTTDELSVARGKLKAATSAALHGSVDGVSTAGDGERRRTSSPPSSPAARSSSSPAASQSTVTSSPAADIPAPPPPPRWAYLRHVLQRYLGAPPGAEGAALRAALEPAICAVLGLTPLEMLAWQRSRGSAASGARSGALFDAPAGTGTTPSPAPSVGSLWSSATALLMGGGTPASSAGSPMQRYGGEPANT